MATANGFAEILFSEEQKQDDCTKSIAIFDVLHGTYRNHRVLFGSSRCRAIIIVYCENFILSPTNMANIQLYESSANE